MPSVGLHHQAGSQNKYDKGQSCSQLVKGMWHEWDSIRHRILKGHSLFQYSLVFVLAETRVLMCLRTVQDNPREVFSHHQPEHRDVVVSTGEVMLQWKNNPPISVPKHSTCLFLTHFIHLMGSMFFVIMHGLWLTEALSWHLLFQGPKS